MKWNSASMRRWLPSGRASIVVPAYAAEGESQNVLDYMVGDETGQAASSSRFDGSAVESCHLEAAPSMIVSRTGVGSRAAGRLPGVDDGDDLIDFALR